MLSSIKLSDIIFAFLYVLLMTTILFDFDFVGGYFDESIALLCLGYLILNLIKIRFEFKIGIFVVLLVIIGTLSTIFNRFEIGLLNYIFSLFMLLKPFLFAGASFFFFKNYKTIFVNKFLIIFSKILIIVLSIFAISFFIKNGLVIPTSSSNGYKFYCSFTGDLAIVCFASIICVYFEEKRINFIYYLLGFFIVLMTASSLGLLGYIVFLCFVLFRKFEFKFYYLPIILAIGILVGWNEFNNYFFNTETARYKMYYYSFLTANEFFPLGSGFGTYGSYVAAHNYSPLYISYGFETVWGLGRLDVSNSTNFLFDTYYPMIIAEFGYFGLVIFVIFIIYSLTKIYKSKNFFAITIIVFVLVMGIGFNIGSASGCILMVCLSYSLINYNKAKENILWN